MTKKDEKNDDTTDLVPVKKESRFICMWREHKTKIVASLIFMFLFFAIVIVLVVKKVKRRRCVSGEYGDICSMYQHNLENYTVTE